MAIHYRYLLIDGALGCEYTFDKEGEHIPSHRHPPYLAHSTRVIRGRAWLEVDGTWRVIREGQEAKDWDSTLPHTLSALEPGTVIFNRLLNLPPPEMIEDLLTDSGTVEST